MNRNKLPSRSSLDRSPEGIDSPANSYLAPSISGEAFAGKPAAYVGKTLHVAIEINSATLHGAQSAYTVWTNDGNEPIARCVDLGTARLLSAAPDLLEALRDLHTECDAFQHEELDEHPSWGPIMRAAAAAIKKGGV